MRDIVSTNEVDDKHTIPQVELSLTSTGTHVYKHTHTCTCAEVGGKGERERKREISLIFGENLCAIKNRICI